MWLRNIVGSGFVGVSLFFVLSGFILAYSYLDVQGQKPLDKRAFWLARFARIYPVYLVGTLVMVPFYLAFLLHQMPVLKAVVKGAGATLVALSLLQAWWPGTAALLNYPSWSLSVEAFFYAVFPFVAPVVGRLSSSRLLGLMGASWLLSLVVPGCYWHFAGPGSPETFNFWIGVVKFNPLVRLPEFLIGVALGRLFLLQSQRATAAWGQWVSMLPVAALGAAFWMLAQGSILPFVLLSNCLLVPAFAVLIFSLAWNRGVLSAFLSLPLVMALGEASYALYIIHVPLYTVMTRAAAQAPILSTSGFLLVYLVCALGASLLLTRFVEKPAREALKRRRARGAAP